MHTPDNWVVIKLPQCYKVLAGWSGGYLDADEWRLNSGITGCHIDGDYYVFAGHSGSLYRCHKDSYGLRTNNAYIFDSFQKKLGEENFKMMPEDTNWLEMDWGLESIESKLIDSGDYTTNDDEHAKEQSYD